MFCPNCGANLQVQHSSSPPPTTPPTGATRYDAQKTGRPERPLGVTIIAVLEALGGLVLLGSGSFLLIFGSFSSVGAGFMVGAFAGALGGLLIILGLLSFIFAWGIWKGKGWAWTLTLIFTILGLIGALVSFNIISLLIDVIILYYLTRPQVKAFFGKGSALI